MDGVEAPTPPAPEPEPAPAFFAADPFVSSPDTSPERVELEAVPLSPEDQPVPAPAASTWRKTLIASFAGALLASAALGWWLLRPAKRIAPPALPVSVAPAPPASLATATPAPSVPASPAPAPPPVIAAPPAPISPAPRSPAKRARRKALARKSELTVSPSSAPAHASAPAPAEDSGFLLPGVPRRPASQSVTKPKADGAAPAADAAEDGAASQVREQFVFCAQLLAQGSYADHFDTCLCADARQAAPYRGSRRSYAAALKKAAAAGALSTSASITGVALDGSVAKLTADWKSGASGKTRAETESWRLEDGLWCRSP
jgi:hypothetical protein